MSPASKPVTELSATDSGGFGLRVSFCWRGDRYYHRIDALDGTHGRPLLESIEGDQQSDWPTSPLLQHVNVSWIASDTEYGHVAMLVGAGKSGHWSMCVAVRDRQCRPREVEIPATKLLLDGAELDKLADTELVFDVACRVSVPSKWLGSSYQALTAPVAISEKWHCACIPTHGPGCVLEPDKAQLEMDTVSSALPILRCTASTPELTEFPATVRWRYAIRWSAGDTLHRTTGWRRRHRH
ncbi:MAG TPA: hypothetical protein VGK58_23350 [Lacipirellulaceae bacterium]